MYNFGKLFLDNSLLAGEYGVDSEVTSAIDCHYSIVRLILLIIEEGASSNHSTCRKK